MIHLKVYKDIYFFLISDWKTFRSPFWTSIYTKTTKLYGAFKVTAMNNVITELSTDFEYDWSNFIGKQ